MCRKQGQNSSLAQTELQARAAKAREEAGRLAGHLRSVLGGEAGTLGPGERSCKCSLTAAGRSQRAYEQHWPTAEHADRHSEHHRKCGGRAKHDGRRVADDSTPRNTPAGANPASRRRRYHVQGHHDEPEAVQKNKRQVAHVKQISWLSVYLSNNSLHCY